MAGQRNSYGKRNHFQSDYAENGGNKRRSHGEDRDRFVIDQDDIVYRYLCPVKKIGSVIGRGGEIVKQLRIDTKSKIRIGETVPGSDERVITMYSSNNETDSMEDSDYVSPAQEALFRVHERVVADDLNDEESDGGGQQVIARLLVPSDQIGCIIGKGGQIVQNIRTETGAQVRILKDDHLPRCALNSDELVQISGELSIVKKALYKIAARLRDNPSRSQHLLASAMPGVYSSGGSLMAPAHGGPIMGLAPMVGPYGGYKGDDGNWSRSLYSAPRDELSSSKEFSLRLICPSENIGGVIGKGGGIINQIRQETRAAIKVDSSSEGVDSLINISSNEFFEDSYSPSLEAALRLQPRCSEKVERDSGIISFTTRLLVPTSRIGCLIGKGGTIITELRRLTKANIRILSKEDLPKVASEDEEMVQISGDIDIAKEALVHIVTRLRANIFDREGALPSILPVMPYLPLSDDGSDGLNYDGRDSKRHGRGHSYSSGGHGGFGDLAAGDGYGSYSDPQMDGAGGSAYGAYGNFSVGRSGGSGASGHGSGGSGASGHGSDSRRRNYS